MFTYIQICKLGYYNYSILEYKIIVLFLNWPYNPNKCTVCIRLKSA